VTYAASIGNYAASIGPATGRRVGARLAFRSAGGGTHLAAQHTPHPFHITRPFRIEGDPQGMATLYLQSSSGGLYGDDDLTLTIAAGAGAAAHVTTQASSIVHHARGGQTRQCTGIAVGPGALVEYCPEPAILFAGARLSAEVDATLAEGGRLILADAALAHDPGGRAVPFDRFANRIRIGRDDGRALLVDRFLVTGADWRRRLGPRPCHGTLTVAGAADPVAVGAALSEAIEGPADAPSYGGVSVLADRGIAIARFLCPDGAGLSTCQARAWAAARTALTGRPPKPRRK